MRTLNDYFITSHIPNVSSASSTFVCVPDGGISHTASGSASRVATAEPTAANRVEEDGTIECITDGSSSNSSKMEITFVIRR